MDNNTLFNLLRIIKNDSALSPLIGLGYSFSQISLLLDDAVDSDYLQINDKHSYVISEKGESFLDEYLEEGSLSGSNRWILPQTIKRIPKIGRYDIVLPDKNQLL